MSEKDELSWSRRQLLAKLDVAMGGRVAEELVFGTEYITSGKCAEPRAPCPHTHTTIPSHSTITYCISSHSTITGASSDLEVATKIAKHMVTKLGMSDLVGVLLS